jgi:hypothetical protein
MMASNSKVPINYIIWGEYSPQAMICHIYLPLDLAQSLKAICVPWWMVIEELWPRERNALVTKLRNQAHVSIALGLLDPGNLLPHNYQCKSLWITRKAPLYLKSPCEFNSMCSGEMDKLFPLFFSSINWAQFQGHHWKTAHLYLELEYVQIVK